LPIFTYISDPEISAMSIFFNAVIVALFILPEAEEMLNKFALDFGDSSVSSTLWHSHSK